ncbi:uncharacterized protein LOC144097819 [Amblyomma americanum]
MNHAKRRTHSKRRSKHGRNERVVEVPSRTSLSENTEELLSFWRGRLYGEQDTAPLTRIHRPGFPHRPPVIADRKSAVHRHHVSQLETRRHYDDSESTSESRSSESASEDSPLSISGSPIMVCAMATVLFGFLIAAIALVLVRTDQELKMQTPFKMHAPRIVVQRGLREQVMRKTLAPTRLIRTRISSRAIAKSAEKNIPVTAAPTKVSADRSTSSRRPPVRTAVRRLDYALLGSSTSGGNLSQAS